MEFIHIVYDDEDRQIKFVLQMNSPSGINSQVESICNMWQKLFHIHICFAIIIYLDIPCSNILIRVQSIGLSGTVSFNDLPQSAINSSEYNSVVCFELKHWEAQKNTQTHMKTKTKTTTTTTRTNKHIERTAITLAKGMEIDTIVWMWRIVYIRTGSR